MPDKNEVKKAFTMVRIAGEQLLSQGKINWGQFSCAMILFEMILREMGEDL